MGRYYETAKPTFVDDVIYQAPHQLIARALEAKDLRVEEDEAEIDEFDVLSEDKKYTEKDKEKRNQIVDAYRTEAHNIAEEIQKNPENRNYYMRRINTARKKFDKEISTGFLNEADRNFTLREAARKQINERKDITDEQRSTALSQLDFEFKGSDAPAGEGNVFSDSFHIYEALDEEKFIKDKKSEITADAITTTTNRTDGRYFTTETGQRKFISDEKLDASFENSAGVGKWEKALLQKLEWQKEQGVISEETMQKTFLEEREIFKQDYINSLGFEQTTDSKLKSRDATWHADQSNAIAWSRLNKEDNIATQDTQVDAPEITVSRKSQETLTPSEKLMTKYNTEGKKIEKQLGDNYSAIEAGLRSSDKEVRRKSIEALKKGGYSPEDITNLRGFIGNKKREYKAVKSKAQRNGYLEIANSTPDTAIVTVKYTKDGVDVIEEMPLHEARILSQKSVNQKVKTEGPASMMYKGQKVAAYKSGSKMIPITDKNKKPVLLSAYKTDGEYAGGRTADIVKREGVEPVKVPYTIKDATVTTSDINKKYDNPYASSTSTKVVNYHKMVDGREIIISIPIDENQANIINKSK